MSWSVSYIGKPENVVKALKEQSERITGQSKIEFDIALPHIEGLINQNYGTNSLISVNGNGHSYKSDEVSNGHLAIRIEVVQGVLV